MMRNGAERIGAEVSSPKLTDEQLADKYGRRDLPYGSVILKDNLKPLILSELYSTKEWAWSKDSKGWFIRQETPDV